MNTNDTQPMTFTEGRKTVFRVGGMISDLMKGSDPEPVFVELDSLLTLISYWEHASDAHADDVIDLTDRIGTLMTECEDAHTDTYRVREELTTARLHLKQAEADANHERCKETIAEQAARIGRLQSVIDDLNGGYDDDSFDSVLASQIMQRFAAQQDRLDSVVGALTRLGAVVEGGDDE